ncbi:MAG: hypothetical protein LCH85_22190 [Chloroflexi bacterium]|nr:hypothetical protein [Chloroflexota bacterium]
MPLVSVAEVRQKIATPLDDSDLATIIDAEEADLIERCGDHPDGSTEITEVARSTSASLWLRHPVVSISSVQERRAGEANSAVTANGYELDAATGKLERIGGSWLGIITISYVPRDQRSRRKRILIELIRLAVEQTAMKSESIAGEYSYTADDWDAKRAGLYRQCGFMPL